MSHATRSALWIAGFFLAGFPVMTSAINCGSFPVDYAATNPCTFAATQLRAEVPTGNQGLLHVELPAGFSSQFVVIKLDLGTDHQRIFRYPDFPTAIAIDPGAHTVDVRDEDPSFIGSFHTFKLMHDGQITKEVAAPYPFSVRVHDDWTLVILPPYFSNPTFDSSAEPATGSGLSPVTVVHNGNFRLPYTITINDQQFVSDDGRDIAIPPLPAGDYVVSVRPVRAHYPQPFQLDIQTPHGVLSTGRDVNNPGDAEYFSLHSGDPLRISIEDPLQSYNMVFRTFRGMPVMLVFNRPYASEVNGGPFVCAVKKQNNYPNTLLRLLGLGQDTVETNLAQKITDAVYQDPPVQEVRDNDITWYAGHLDLPALKAGGSGALRAELKQKIHVWINQILRQPYRESDAHGFLSQANADFGKVTVDPIHFAKATAMAEFGDRYLHTWERVRLQGLLLATTDAGKKRLHSLQLPCP